MRHFAQELHGGGLRTTSLQAETLAQMQPADYGFAEWARALVERPGGVYRLLSNKLWRLQPQNLPPRVLLPLHASAHCPG